MESRKRREEDLVIDDRPMSKEEIIQDCLDYHKAVAFHGKKEDLEKILVHIPYHFDLKLDNGIRPEHIIGCQQYFNHEPFTRMVPPAWYTEFCTYSDENKDRNCALVIYDLTKCEPSKQVYLNSLLLNNSLRADLWPLPSNSAVFVMVADKDEVEYEYYNLTGDVFRRLSHIFLDEDWKNKPETGSSSKAE